MILFKCPDIPAGKLQLFVNDIEVVSQKMPMKHIISYVSGQGIVQHMKFRCEINPAFDIKQFYNYTLMKEETGIVGVHLISLDQLAMVLEHKPICENCSQPVDLVNICTQQCNYKSKNCASHFMCRKSKSIYCSAEFIYNKVAKRLSDLNVDRWGQPN